LLWEDAFKEDSNLAEAGVVLDNETFQKLLHALKSKAQRVHNPLWLKNISVHLSDGDFRTLLETHNPFKELADA